MIRPIRRSPSGAIAFLALVLLLPSSCTVGPDYEPPQLALPAAWQEQAAELTSTRGPDPTAWWQQLADPRLDALVLRALAGGLELQQAYARLRESRAMLGATMSDLAPTLDANASLTRINDSARTPFGAFATEYSRHAGSLDTAWELDLWGRVRRAVEAADADLLAVTEDVRDVAVTVAAETTLAYVGLRAAQHRLAIALANVELQQQTLALVRGRFEAGLVGERDVAQATTNVESTRARVPALAVEVRTAENRLAVLVGSPPGALALELAEVAPVPVPPAEVGVGVPADLLRRRPDVRRAEREVAAATARVGIAIADHYPRLSLSGTLGVVADASNRVFDGSSGTFGFGPAVRWSLFDAGRTRRLVAAQEARVEQAMLHWQRTVLIAVEEAENAMTAFVRGRQRRDALVAAVAGARASVELARGQYEQGLSDFQTVLDSERALADLEDVLAESSATVTTSLVRLYKALGGGWALPGEAGGADGT